MVEGLEKIPEIVDFIDPELEATLEAYFQSHFKIFGVYFYHTEPNPARPYSSFLWHADNCPSEEIKLMVYLDDVASDTGAMRLKTRSFSDDLKNRGFIGRDRYESFSRRARRSGIHLRRRGAHGNAYPVPERLRHTQGGPAGARAPRRRHLRDHPLGGALARALHPHPPPPEHEFRHLHEPLH